MKEWLILLLTAVLLTAFVNAYASSLGIVINEVELNPSGTDSGAETVELFNAGGIPVDVGGWTLTSTAGRTANVTIEDPAIIEPGGFLVVRSAYQWLDNENERIILEDVNGTIVDASETFSDDADDGRTWQRSPDAANDWVFEQGTMGESNTGTPDEPNPEPIPEPTPEPQPQPPLFIPGPGPPLVISPSEPNRTLTIIFIDVGQGSSTLIILPNGKSVLIDGGERDASESVTGTLQQFNISRIDVIVATHPHSDHIGGLIDVIQNFEVGEVLDSGQIHNTQTFEDLLDAIDAKDIPLASLRQGDTIDIDSSVELEVLNPPTTLEDGADDESKFNDNSVVIRLSYGEFSALLTGDMESGNEQRLVDTIGNELSADVLLVGHHGSNSSSTLAFIEAVNPDVAVIPVGAGNDYGHPHAETIQRLNSSGILHILRTDLDGSIILVSSGSEEYSFETTRSNKAVVVPEFGSLLLIATVGLSTILVMMRMRAWKLSRLA